MSVTPRSTKRVPARPLAYSVVEAAAVVGIDKGEIYKALREQRLQGILVDGRRLISAAALREFLTAS